MQHGDLAVQTFSALDSETDGRPPRNLFLTGPMGCGKSTCIARALGQHMAQAGGFLTVRQRDETGQAAAFLLCLPNGESRQAIISRNEQGYAIHPEVFETFGITLLEEAKRYPFVVLDEIGGFEVLSQPVLDALIDLLSSHVPCIGVMKGAGPAGKMIDKLGLGQAYTRNAEVLRGWMSRNTHTLLYECSQFDPEAQRLAEAWVRAYVK